MPKPKRDTSLTKEQKRDLHRGEMQLRRTRQHRRSGHSSAGLIGTPYSGPWLRRIRQLKGVGRPVHPTNPINPSVADTAAEKVVGVDA